jgi:hypothetical protein
MKIKIILIIIIIVIVVAGVLLFYLPNPSGWSS